MIEVEEVKNELEQPTETDIRLLFADLQKPMEALQKVFAYALEKLTSDSVNVERTSIEIEQNTLIVRLGAYRLYHRVIDDVFYVGEK